MPPTNAEIAEIQKHLSAANRLLKRLILKYQRVADTRSRQELLYQHALLTRGRDASPLDIVNDELGCAESVTQLIKKVIPIPIITGTWTLNEYFKNSPRFVAGNKNSGQGTIVIAATGTGNGKIRGHVGILGPGFIIMSANSRTGLWGQNYTQSTWAAHYEKHGGFRSHYYKLT